ncbi:MAG TPA: glycosyltransferase family 87 protein [Solirubrobacteraceae bacterium]|nr:glycosyltransferase family 87 protein [Solirubrobacteraceae bacterium]
MRHDPAQGGMSAALPSRSAARLGAGQADTAVVLPGVGLSGARSGLLRRRMTLSRPVYGLLALGALIAGALAVAVFAAAEPTVLVPRSRFDFPGWLAGPLHGIFGPLIRAPQTLGYGFSVVLVVMTVAYGVALASVRLLSMRTIVIAVVALHAVILLSPPLQLNDVFNYLGYARLGALHNLNPYVHVIVNERHDPVYALTTWYNLRSPYGPAFTLLTYPLALLPLPVAYWVLKTATVLASLAFIALVWRCARQLGRDPRFAVLFVAANPIFLVYELGGFHNDVFMLVPAMAAISLLLDGRDRGSGAALMLAIAIKFTAVLMLPFLLLAARPVRRQARVLVGLALAAVPLVAASILAFGHTIPNLSDQSSLLTNFSIPNLAGLLLGQGGGTPTLVRLAVVAVVLIVAVLLWRRGDWLTGSGWATLALVCSLSWLVPWYIVWVLPLAALGTSIRLRRATVAFTVFLVLSFVPATGLIMTQLKLTTMNGAASQASLARQAKLEH